MKSFCHVPTGFASFTTGMKPFVVKGVAFSRMFNDYRITATVYTQSSCSAYIHVDPAPFSYIMHTVTKHALISRTQPGALDSKKKHKHFRAGVHEHLVTLAPPEKIRNTETKK